MANEINFNVVELQKITLGKGDVLSAKLIGDDFEPEVMDSLKEHLQTVFPNNRIMVFTMPTKTDIVFEVIGQEPDGCSTSSYCDDCNCGKKERIEGEQNG